MNSSPGGSYDGTYIDDFEYVSGLGTLDECNGMTINGQYGYYAIKAYPYIINCFKGSTALFQESNGSLRYSIHEH